MGIDILGIACLVYVFIEVADVPFKIKVFLKNRGITKKLIRLRPIDCEGCLGFWLGIVYFYSQCNTPLQTLLLASITSTLSILIFLLMKKAE